MKIIFRVGLVLLKQMLGSVDKLRELQGMYETMERLRNISPDSIREDLLVQEVGLVDRAQKHRYESERAACLHFLPPSAPPSGHHAVRDRGAHREGVQHPGEEVERVQGGADAPAGPPPPRHPGHL